MTNDVVQADLESAYGSVNIAKWADPNNTQSAVVIAARVTWSIELAADYINGRLVHSGYDVPFEDVPELIVKLTAMQAGMLLYDTRRVVSDERDQVSAQRKMIDSYIRQIMRGQLKLFYAGVVIEKTSKNQPFVA